MGEMDITTADYGDMTNAVTDYSVDPASTDGATDQKETEYMNREWTQQLGYYKKIPELKASIDALARWTVGKGFLSNEITEMLLMTIKGNGNDTFNTILENMTRTAKIGGDSYAEIIRDNEDILVNLKPLDPQYMKIVANRKGLITRYEQTKKGKSQKFKPEEIFHLSRNRTADEMHGESLIDAVKEIILMRNEAMADMKILMHRHVKPIIKWQLDTDDATEIAAFKVKADAAVENGENLFIPKDAVDAEILSVPANSTLNPLPWINTLTQLFFQATGVPQIIVGGSQEMTEATVKIAYVAFEQTVSEEQLYIEEQVLAQLNLEIELEPPISLRNEMINSESKSETMQASTPEDTTAEETPVGEEGGEEAGNMGQL